MNTQYHFQNHQLTLEVKRSPVFVRGVLYFFAALFFTLPMIGVVANIQYGNGLHFGYFVGLFVFGLLGFFLLRIALWNTFGKEVLVFGKDVLTYHADYGLFKDGKKEFIIDANIHFEYQRIGDDEDKLGILIIEMDVKRLQCVTKMPVHELEELSALLTKEIHP